MTSELRPDKPDPAKPARTRFGAFCPTCKRFSPIAVIDIEPSAGFSKLRRQLRVENFQSRKVTCDDPKCGHAFDVTVDELYLGEPDDTLPTRETFW